jgi:Ca2+-binding EF-hand superfamily protein
MTARISVVVASLGLALATVAGETPGEGRPKAEVPEKGQDIIFLAPSRPVLIRLHVEMDGRSLREAARTATDEYLSALFRHLDRNGDGFLSEAEATHVPPPLLSLPGSSSESVHVAFNFRALDADGDGKVSQAELKEYYQHFQGDTFVYHFHTGGSPSGAALSQRLFTLLDTDGDGKLSKDEIAAAAKVLAKLDTDGDEILTPQEVAPGVFPAPNPFAEQVGQVPPQPRVPDNRDFLFLTPDLPPAEVAQAIIARYSRQREGLENSRLRRTDIALEPDLFRRLDRNGDGQLDLKELEAFADRAADIELKVRLGERAKEAALLEVVRPTEKTPLSASVRKAGDGAVVLQFGASRVELRCDRSRMAARFFATMKQMYLREFRTADADGNGHVDRGEGARSPFLRGIFAALDRNEDGKVEEKEMLEYIDRVLVLHARALACRASLVVSPAGTGLWDLLDTNRDGVLGLRELRAAPAVLAALDRDADGKVDPARIPASHQLALGMGEASLNRLSGDVVVEVSPSGRLVYPPETLGGGPLWFRKMDRNGDGDVSPGEFLGTPEQFKKLDLDGDGLISREEAELAEAQRKEKK